MRSRCRRGFTLIELIIALTLSVVVLVGIIAVATSVVSFHMDSAVKGNVTSGTLLALQRMQAELEQATYIAAPAWGGTGDALGGCTNWSQNMGARLDTSQSVLGFYYCVDSSNRLVRYENSGVVCTVPTAGVCGGGTPESIVVHSKPGFFRMDGVPYYFGRGTNGEIEVHYIVGLATPTASNIKPQALKVNSVISTNKAYTNSLD